MNKNKWKKKKACISKGKIAFEKGKGNEIAEC